MGYYFGAVMSGQLAVLLLRKKIFSTTVTRKLFQCICTPAYTDLFTYITPFCRFYISSYDCDRHLLS